MAIKSAGELDRRIVVERLTEIGRDSFNEPILEWGVLLSTWARRRDASDQERFEAAEISATLMSRFVVRSNSVTKTISPVDRLSHEGAVWNINGIKETLDGRARFLEITATKDAD